MPTPIELLRRPFHPECEAVRDEEPLAQRVAYGVHPKSTRPRNFYHIISIGKDSIDGGWPRIHKEWEHLILTRLDDDTFEVTSHIMGLATPRKTGYFVGPANYRELSTSVDHEIIIFDPTDTRYHEDTPFDGWWVSVQTPGGIVKIVFFTKRDMCSFAREIMDIVDKEIRTTSWITVPLPHFNSLESSLAKVHKNPYEPDHQLNFFSAAFDHDDPYMEWWFIIQAILEAENDERRTLGPAERLGVLNKPRVRPEDELVEFSDLSEEEHLELINGDQGKETDSEISELPEEEWEDLTKWMEDQKL
ncbi:MAG: hypothetical protein Q9191_001908 [Dirinaria sp. TL-2023a]